MKKPRVPDGIVELISKIKDIDLRATACCLVGMTGDDPRCRLVLESCLEASSFWQKLIQERLEWWKSPPKARQPGKPRPKVRKTFTGLPSLIAGIPSDFDRMMANTYEPHPSSVENAGTALVEHLDIVDALAFATLNTELGDMRGYGSAEDLIPFLDLVESITDKDRELIAEKLRAMPPLEVIDLVPNLFRDFGIEINDETATQQAVMNDVMSGSKKEAGND